MMFASGSVGLRSLASLGSKQRFMSVSSSGQRVMSQHRAKVVVVGSGRMGHIRSSLIYANPRFELCGIVDVNYEGASSMANSFCTTPFQTLDDAIHTVGRSQGPLDAVIVCSPTSSHKAVITEAARHGLDVFTEKPVDETAQKIVDLFEIADRGGISLCCGFQRRFDDSYVAAANAVRSNEIGTPVTANIFFADHPCPPIEFLLKGGNIFMDLSAHDVDFIMQALDDDVVSVYATGTSSTNELALAGVHDNANVLMKFSRGTTVNLFMSRSATYGYDQRFECFGSKGLISTTNEHAHSAVLSNANGVTQSKLKHSFPQRFNQAFASELDAFASTLLEAKPWPVTADHCIRVQKVADAAKLSCDEDRVVHITNDDHDVAVEAVAYSAIGA